jgi:hypothetical protein
MPPWMSAETSVHGNNWRIRRGSGGIAGAMVD